MPSQQIYRRSVRRHNDEGSLWPDRLSARDQTAASTISPQGDLVDAASQTLATTLTQEAGSLRLRADVLGTDVKRLHQDVYISEWRQQTQKLVHQGSSQLLEQLAELGFAWRDVARMVGVSVPAVQKWRKGTQASPDNRLALASLLAAKHVLLRNTTIQDFAQWLEVPFVQDVPLTPLDLWATGAYELVFEYALEQLSPEEVLDAFQPDWREAYASEWETFVAGDGGLSIRTRDR